MIILYDGIGSDPCHMHTPERFLEIMNKEITNANWTEMDPILKCIQCDYKEWILPDDFIFFTLEDWLDYSGGVKVDT